MYFFLNPIKHLSSHPLTIRIVRFLHLVDLMKSIYYKLYSPKDSQKCLYFNELAANFHVRNFEELLLVGAVFEKGNKNEGSILAPLIQMLQPGDVAYDIGANIGIHTIFMAKKVGDLGRIIAFEPEINSYGTLKQNISLNSLNNTTPTQVALGDRVESGSLYIKRRIGAGSVGLIKGEESSFCQRVEIVPADFLVKSKKIPLPNAVKIDVEGYEYQVIKGMQKTLSQEKCQLVCCEIHSHLFPLGVKTPMIIELLKSLGFTHIETQTRGSEIHAICYKN